MSKGKLLIIEDDPGLQSQMRWCFDDLDVYVAGTQQEAETLLRREAPEVVTLDLGVPPDPGGTSAGLALLQTIGKLLPESKTIVITGREDRENALQSIGLGAYDFYQKPIDSETLQFVVDRAFKLKSIEDENRRLNEGAGGNMPLPGLIATSQAMLTLCHQVERIAPTDATVLIRGETGTGKEVVAHNIHRLSPRANGPMITINCAAIPENLLESELFGHEKGSFTGAHARKIGKIEAANGGTLFLDEIGDMPLPLQAKILRFLQERSFERVGSHVSINADVRVISATHRPVEDMISAGEFREDLFFRVSEIALDLPPLRERGADVLLIAKDLLQRYQDGRSLSFSPEAAAAIETAEWPGNIRELENRVKRAAILVEGNQIEARDLELHATEDAPSEPLNLKEVRTIAERNAINKALVHTNGNVSQTARLLGVSRPTLYNLIDKYDISLPH